jgi:hypothetical protein
MIALVLTRIWPDGTPYDQNDVRESCRCGWLLHGCGIFLIGKLVSGTND